MPLHTRTGDAVFRCDGELRVAEWNRAATALTGIEPQEAVGRQCWEVIAGRDADGGLVCHPGCATARLAKQGWPVECRDLHMRTPAGRLRVSISTIVVDGPDEPVILHPIRPAGERPRAAEADEPPRLTNRQLEILGLLAGGVRVKEIARRLTLSETTVRNHIRAVLLQFGAHSQLEAVARARQFELVA